MDKNELLDALLMNLVAIQKSLETEDEFPEDDPIRREMRNIVADKLELLVRHLREMGAWMPMDLRMSLGTFKDTTLDLMLTGLTPESMPFATPRALTFVATGGLFQDADGSGQRYTYEFEEPLDIFDAQALPADLLFARFLADVRQSAEKIDHYASKRVFEEYVFKKVVALLFAIEAAGGKFDAGDDGGQEHDAPVPRDPVPPRLSGEAAEAIPEAQSVPAEALYETSVSRNA